MSVRTVMVRQRNSHDNTKVRRNTHDHDRFIVLLHNWYLPVALLVAGRRHANDIRGYPSEANFKIKCMRKRIANWINCKIFGMHDWTSNAQEGIPATDKQLKSGIQGFYEYARMYCKHCKKPSKFNKA